MPNDATFHELQQVLWFEETIVNMMIVAYIYLTKMNV